MPNTNVLDFLIDGPGDGVFEPRSHLNTSGALLGWQAAAVRGGAGDTHTLYQSDSAGNIYLAETGVTDNAVAITTLWTSKKFDMGAVSMVHDVWIRLTGATDSATLTCTVGGSEYGTVSHTYTLTLSGTGDMELKTRTHRDLLGRWCQLSVSGAYSNRPAIREVKVNFVPVRSGRVSS